jgi:hypothetical protein
MVEAKDLIDVAISLSDGEQMHAYVANGRQLQQLSNEQLLEKWEHVMLALDEAPFSTLLWGAESDIRHEAEIRGALLPEETTKQALTKVMERLRGAALKVVNDPAARQRFEQKLQEQLSQAAAQLTAETKN